MGEWRYSSTILDLGTRWKCVVSIKTRPLYPREKSPDSHWIGGCVGSRAGLHAMEKRKNLPLPGQLYIFTVYRVAFRHSFDRRREPHLNLEIRPSNPYPVAIPTELSRLIFM
jgi:hypothetical protein